MVEAFVSALIERVKMESSLLMAATVAGDDAAIALHAKNLLQIEQEGEAVRRAYFDQLGHPFHGSPGEAYPFRDEKEAARICAKRNDFEAATQEFIGVSEETADDYTDEFREKYLKASSG